MENDQLSKFKAKYMDRPMSLLEDAIEQLDNDSVFDSLSSGHAKALLFLIEYGRAALRCEEQSPSRRCKECNKITLAGFSMYRVRSKWLCGACAVKVDGPIEGYKKPDLEPESPPAAAPSDSRSVENRLNLVERYLDRVNGNWRLP